MVRRLFQGKSGSSAISSILTILAIATGPASAEEAESDYEVWFRASARVRSARADADLEAGGRLLMAGHPSGPGQLVLTLSEVLEAPWKLYWVDPLGPFGEEVKVASVIALPEASWEALELARAEAGVAAKGRHHRWLESADRPRDLDGAFSFIVIDHPTDRFRVEIGADGSVEAVTNRLTDRWLSGPFDRFIGSWGDVARAGQALQGYWFWNDGEASPPDFEPHTYRGFQAALELLALPLTAARNEGLESVEWPGVDDDAVRVLQVLAPKAGFAAPEAAGPPRTLRLKRSSSEKAGSRLEVIAVGPGTHPDLERETVFSSQGWPVSDRIRVRISSQRNDALVLEAGYRRVERTEESR